MRKAILAPVLIDENDCDDSDRVLFGFFLNTVFIKYVSAQTFNFTLPDELHESMFYALILLVLKEIQ